MKLIIGLGNPGEEYKNTRHNLGFMVIDALVQDSNFKIFKKELNKKHQAEVIKGQIKDNGVILAKPQTFMNLSGEATQKIINYYKINLNNLWIIIDDINLPLGKLKIKTKGSSGGHKGLESIIKTIKTDEITRFRLGIGQEEKIPKEKYVLQKFTIQELPIIKKAIQKTKEAIIFALENGINKAMTKYNQKEEL